MKSELKNRSIKQYFLMVCIFGMLLMSIGEVVRAEGDHYTVYINQIKQPHLYVDSKELLNSLETGAAFRVLTTKECVYRNYTVSDLDKSVENALDIESKIIYLMDFVTDGCVWEDGVTITGVIRVTELVHVYFKHITERGCVAYDAGYVARHSEVIKARESGGTFPVYNSDGVVQGYYNPKDFMEGQYGDLTKYSSIWDYVSKDYPILSDMIDYNKSYSNFQQGDIVSLVRMDTYAKPGEGCLMLYIYDPEMYPKQTYIVLDDGNKISYLTDYHTKAMQRTVKLSKKIDKKYTGKKFKYAEEHSMGHKDDEEQLKVIAKKVTKGCKTNYEKAYAIAKWMSMNLKYDLYKRSSQGFAGRGGVCGDFSQWFQYMCMEVDVPCIGVISEMHNHGWNAVYVDGHWMIIDLTEDVDNVSGDRARFNSKLICDNEKDAKIWKQSTEFVGIKIKKGKKITQNGITYKITNCQKNDYTVSVVAAKANKRKEIDIPAWIRYDGVFLRVTEINCNFKDGNYQLKEVCIGDNVKKIKGNIATKNTIEILFISEKIKDWSKVKLGCKNSAEVAIIVPKSVYKTYKKKIKAKKSKVEFGYI